MNIKIIFIKTRANYTYYVYVNGKRVAKTTKSGFIIPYKNQNMFIKHGGHDYQGYDAAGLNAAGSRASAANEPRQCSPPSSRQSSG